MYLHIDDPDFWGQGPEASADARALADAVGIKVRHFLLTDSGEAEADGSGGSGGPGGNSKPPVAALMYQPPGWCLPRHSHPSHRLEIIIRGSLRTEGETLGPGDVMVSKAGEVYGPHVAGPEGVLTVEIFGTLDGVGGRMEDPSLDTKTVLNQLAESDLSDEERRTLIEHYVERMRAYGAAQA